MSAKNIEDRRKYWLEKINQWKASKKTAFSWCRENNIKAKTFYNWRSFFNKNKNCPPKIGLDSFIEVPNKPSQFEIEIEYKKYNFKLKNFDFEMMKNFMIILKRL